MRCRLVLIPVSVRFPCYLSKGPLKRDILDIYLTTFLGVCKIKNTSAMRVIFLLEIFKIKFNFWKCEKKVENIFCFWESCISKCCYKLSLLTRKYLLLAVNGLTNSPKILHITQRDFFNLNFLQRDESTCKRCCLSLLNSVLAGLPFYLSKGLLETGHFWHLSNHVFRSP